MKNLLIAAAALALSMVSCQSAKNSKTFTTQDSIAYAMASDFGAWAKQMDSTLNVKILQQGIAEAFAGKSQITSEDARMFLNEWFGVRKPALDLAEGKAWLEKVKAENPAIQTTASGLMYEIVNEGDTANKATNDADQVVVNYALSLKDGKEIQRNDSIPFALNAVIPAWTEGVKLIGKGGKINLWVPSELGYGARATGNIPANSALKFEIELLEVTPAAPTETPAQ